MTVRRALARAIAFGVVLALCPLPARAAAVSAGTDGAPPSRVRWDDAGDFASLLARAGKANKLVFVDFFATWCGPCKMLDRDVYPDSLAAASTNRMLSRKIDAEKGEGVALAGRYAVHAYPTLLVVDGTGKEVARQTGYVPAPRFARFLDDARTGRGTAAALQAKIAHGEDTVDNRLALVEKATETHDFATARAQLDALAARDTANGGAQVAVLWVALVRAEAGADDAARVIADGGAFRAHWPQATSRFEVLELEANSHAARAEKDSAVAKFRAIKDGEPNDANAQAGFARFCAAQKSALDEALAAAQKAVTLSDGKAAGPLDALADVYAARGQFDLAVDTAQRALDLNPNDGSRRGRLETFQEQAVEALHAPPAGASAKGGTP